MMAGDDADVSSMLENLQGKAAGLGGLSVVEQPLGEQADNIYLKPDGVPICCLACKAKKNSQDPVDDTKKLAWNFHGRESDVTRHALLDLYCEIVNKKIKSNMSTADFVAWAQTDDGKRELFHYRNCAVHLKKNKGPKGRISALDWGNIPAPEKVTRDTETVVAVEAPDEEFFSPED